MASKGNGYLSLETADIPNTKKKACIMVFRSMIGKTLFEGVLNANVSKIRKVDEKAYK